jgi:hypothetical protein
MWQLPVDVDRDGLGYWLSSAGALLLRSWSPVLAAHVGSGVTLGVRTSGLVRHERGEAEAKLVRIVPGAVGGLLCRWGDRMITAVGSASPADVGTTIRLRVDRPQLFDSATGSRLA